MLLRILAMFMFAGGLILLLFGSYAMESMPTLAVYTTFSAFVLWGVASLFIIVSPNHSESKNRIRTPNA